jgi:diaminopimelate decarboxylase
LQHLQDIGFKIFFPVKSLPYTPFLKKIAEDVDGFDISNIAEINLLKGITSNLTVSSPSVSDIQALQEKKKKALFAYQSSKQLKLVTKDAPFLVRLNPYDLVAKGIQKFPSRFGLTESLLTPELFKRKNFRGIATHFGAGNNSSEFVINYLSELEKLCRREKIQPQILNLGGGWLGFSLSDYRFVYQAARKLFPNAELIIEDGAELTRQGISLNATICDVTSCMDDHFFTLDISFEAHLRWSSPSVTSSFAEFSPATANSKSKRFWLCGGSCSESDRLGPYTMDKEITPALLIGKKISLNNVLGYSISWNTGFNGIAPLKVRIID